MPNTRARAVLSSGLKNPSNELRGRSSPGLRNASLASSGTGPGRSGSPGGIGSSLNSQSRTSGSTSGGGAGVGGGSPAPWASIKPPAQSSTSTSQSNLLSDFPTAGEVVRAQKLHEEKLAHHAAEEAARQERHLQELERFRGNMTHSGSGTQWDELEDGEEDDFLDGVVEFADGTKYEIEIPIEDQQQSSNQQIEETQQEISKEERFKDVNHDRSWPPTKGQEDNNSQTQKLQRLESQPSSILASSSKTSATSTSSRPSPWGNLSSTTSSGREAPPHASSSTLATSPKEVSSTRRPSAGRLVGWDRTSTDSDGFDQAASGRGEKDRRMSSGNRGGRPTATQLHPQSISATQPSQAAPAPSSARAWGTLAQRSALLDPDAPKPSPPSASPTTRSAHAQPSTSASRPPVPTSRPPVTTAQRGTTVSNRDLPPHALMTASAAPASSTSAAQISSPVTATSRAAPTTNPWGNRKHTAGPLSPSISSATPAPTLTIPSSTTSNPTASIPQPISPSVIKSPTSPSLALSPSQVADPQRGEMLTAAERARRRREEEEKARAAEKERARKKAAEIEERMRKEKEAKERVEREKLEEERKEKVRLEEERQAKEEEKKRELENERFAAVAVADMAKNQRNLGRERSSQPSNSGTTPDAWRRSAAPLPPQSSAMNQERKPFNQALEESASRVEQARKALSGKTQLRTSKDPVQRDSPNSASSTVKIGAPSGTDLAIPTQDRARLAVVSPSSEATSWRRAAPLPSSSSENKGGKETTSPQPPLDLAAVGRQQRASTAAAPASSESAPPRSPEVQKQILPRQTPRSSTITAPSPPVQARPTAAPTTRTQLPPSSPSKSLSNLDDVISRIKGAMTNQPPARNAPTTTPTPAVNTTAPVAPPTGPASLRVPPTGPAAQMQQAKVRPSVQVEEPKVAEQLQLLSRPQQPPAQQQQQAKAIPTQPAARPQPPIQPEPQTTRSEVPLDPPPVWNRFKVKIVKAEASKGSSSKRRVRIEVPEPPDVAPVYPLTWEPPILTLPSKTLSRDAQFFPKAFSRGVIIAPVNLPRKVLTKASVPRKAPIAAKVAEVKVPPSTTPVAPAPSIATTPAPKANIPKVAVKLPTPASTPNGTAPSAQAKKDSNEISWRLTTRTGLPTPPTSNPPSAPAAMRTSHHPSSSPSPAPASRSKMTSPITSSQVPSVSPTTSSRPSPFRAAVSAAVGQAITSTMSPTIASAAEVSISSTSDPKAPGSSRQQSRSRGASGSGSGAVAFHPSMGLAGGRDTPSPVSFMVNSELETARKEAGVGSSGSSALAGVPVSSTRNTSASQTPASAVSS